MATLHEVETLAMTLSPEDREILYFNLADEFDGEIDESEEWGEELQRRIDAVSSGEMSTISLEEFKKRSQATLDAMMGESCVGEN